MKQTEIDSMLRNRVIAALTNFIGRENEEFGADVLRTGANEIAFSLVDEAGEDRWVCVKISVPKGSRDGEPYDAECASLMYADKVREQKEKKEKALRDKVEKMERDRKAREKKKAEKERLLKEKEEREKNEEGDE